MQATNLVATIGEYDNATGPFTTKQVVQHAVSLFGADKINLLINRISGHMFRLDFHRDRLMGPLLGQVDNILGEGRAK